MIFATPESIAARKYTIMWDKLVYINAGNAGCHPKVLIVPQDVV